MLAEDCLVCYGYVSYMVILQDVHVKLLPISIPHLDVYVDLISLSIPHVDVHAYNMNKWVFNQSGQNAWVVFVLGYSMRRMSHEIALLKNNESVFQPRLIKHFLYFFIPYYP